MKKKISPVRRNFNGELILLAFAFLLYGNSLFFGYALDDSIVIRQNQFTTQGIGGIGEIFSYDSFTGFFGVQKTLVAGGRYRPLSIATFAIEYGILGGPNPFVSHLLNILLYAATGILIFRLFRWLPAFRIEPGKGISSYLNVPFLAALVFLAHPVHTEVVANIKGRDEILALLFSLLALRSALRYTDTGRPLHLLWSALLFLLGLLSKENTMMFLFVIPLTIWFFTTTPAKRNLTALAAIAASALIFIWIRYLVLGYILSPQIPQVLLNDPFLEAAPGQRLGTILLTLGLYLKLLIIPWPLTHDYYPYHIALTNLTSAAALIPLLLYIALMAYALLRLKKRDPVAWGILFYLITLSIVSNLFFAVGTFMNERFIYMPSLGIILALVVLLLRAAKRWFPAPGTYRSALLTVILIVLIPFTALTIHRNQVWQNDFILFTTDVNTSVNSLKCTTAAGGSLVDSAQNITDPARKDSMLAAGMAYLEKAVSIYPKNNNSLVLLGNATWFRERDALKALGYYLRVLSFDPNDPHALSNAIKMIGFAGGTADEGSRRPGGSGPVGVTGKRTLYLRLYTIQPNDAALNHTLGRFYGQELGNLDSAAIYLERAATLAPADPSVFKDLGTVYGMKGNYPRAIQALEQGLRLDPNDQDMRRSLEISRQALR